MKTAANPQFQKLREIYDFRENGFLDKFLLDSNNAVLNSDSKGGQMMWRVPTAGIVLKSWVI